MNTQQKIKKYIDTETKQIRKMLLTIFIKIKIFNYILIIKGEYTCKNIKY